MQDKKRCRPEEKGSSKLGIFLIVLGITILGGCGYMFYAQYQKEQARIAYAQRQADLKELAQLNRMLSYIKALNRTSNRVAQNKGSLEALEKAILEAGGTERQAQEAIVGVIDTRAFLFENDRFARYVMAVVRAERVKGIPIYQSVSNLDRINSSSHPTDAAYGVSKKHSFLTLAGLEQIRQLENSGQEHEATMLAMDLYVKFLGE